MRLINTQTLKLEEHQSNIPTYAILSHTWGDEEVSFADWQSSFAEVKTKAGFLKIQHSCKQACDDGYQYLWCDTNCIDKRSSAELSEAINSMFTWYENSAVCYAYLADVPPTDLSRFSSSRWFTRGWTLQELLAPPSLTFFAQDWSVVGTRTSLSKLVFKITKIKEEYMGNRLYNASISERMSWVSRSETSRVEDIAYCMLGIFDINMPLLYGEGSKAFIRLQEEIIRVSNDQTIFCWHWDNYHVPSNWTSMLSPSPRTFEHSASYYIAPGTDDTVSYSMSNSGLSISLAVLTVAGPEDIFTDWFPKLQHHESDRCLAVLNVCCREFFWPVGLILRKPSYTGRLVRLNFPPSPVPVPQSWGILPTAMCIAGTRVQEPLITRSRDLGHAPMFGVLVVASNSSSSSTNGCIATYPRPSLHCGTHALCPLDYRYFGTVFSVETTIERQTEDAFKTLVPVTALCFVGVDVQNSATGWGCKALEIHDTTASWLDVGPRISHYENEIRGILHHTRSFTALNLTGTSQCISDELGIGMSMVLGPSIRVSENSKLSVAHIRLPRVTRLLQEGTLHGFSF